MSKPIMSAVTVPRAIATGFVIAAIAAVLAIGRRPSNDAPLPSSQLAGPAPTRTTPRAADVPTLAVSGTPIDAKVRELNAMSETFRNTTFLIAIRDGGFVCNELLRVSGGLDDSPKWMATCSETLAYTIGVTSNGTLRVEPFLQYFDGVGVRPIEQVLPPEPLPQPR
jgi:hypothetical protein